MRLPITVAVSLTSNKNNPDRATADFKKAIALKPDYEATYNNYWPKWLPLKEVREEAKLDSVPTKDLGRNVIPPSHNTPANTLSVNMS